MTDKQPQPKRVEVTLDKPHTHAGKPYAAGGKIMVTEAEADWLRKAGVITDATKEAKPK